VFHGSVFAEYSVIIKVADFTDAVEVGAFLEAFDKKTPFAPKFNSYFQELSNFLANESTETSGIYIIHCGCK
jgi:hypothetical protein